MSKKVWITGASSGIGRALAIKFANEGWQVAASARRENLLKELNKENSNILPFPLNVTNLENTKNVFKNILTTKDGVDLCIFGAAIYDPNYEKEINEKKIREIMEVNFFGVINCIKTVEKYFKNEKKGHISIAASTAGYRGLFSVSGYGASKAALINLAESLYLMMYKYGVKVTLINTGFVKTPLTEQNNFEITTGFEWSTVDGLRYGERHNKSWCYLEKDGVAIKYYFDTPTIDQNVNLRELDLTRTQANEYKKY